MKCNKNNVHLRRSVVTLIYTSVRRERERERHNGIQFSIHLRRSVVTLIYTSVRMYWMRLEIRTGERERVREKGKKVIS